MRRSAHRRRREGVPRPALRARQARSRLIHRTGGSGACPTTLFGIRRIWSCRPRRIAAPLTREHLQFALADFGQRERRMGGAKPVSVDKRAAIGDHNSRERPLLGHQFRRRCHGPDGGIRPCRRIDLAEPVLRDPYARALVKAATGPWTAMLDESVVAQMKAASPETAATH